MPKPMRTLADRCCVVCSITNEIFDECFVPAGELWCPDCGAPTFRMIEVDVMLLMRSRAVYAKKCESPDDV